VQLHIQRDQNKVRVIVAIVKTPTEKKSIPVKSCIQNMKNTNNTKAINKKQSTCNRKSIEEDAQTRRRFKSPTQWHTDREEKERKHTS